MKSAIYPGSFDPFTYGHLDVVRRAAGLFDKLVIAIGTNSRKQLLFSAAERHAIIAEDLLLHQLTDNYHVEVQIFTKTLTEYITDHSVTTIVRGLRNHIDMVNESQMAKTNSLINPSCDTIFLMSNHSFISSSIIKEIVSLGGSVTNFVSPHVEKRLREKLPN